MQKTKDILKKVRKVEIRTKQLVDGLLQGAYHSVFKGRGIEFSEVREYVPGDDVRSIDWNVTARMNHPFVKEFIEERDLTVYLVVDFSASGDFGSEKAKKETIIELAASLMFAALSNNDRVGLCMFTDKIERYVPPRKGRRHILKLVRDMVTGRDFSKGTDIRLALRFLSHVINRRSIIFLVSDFFAEEKYDNEMRLLKRKNDVIAININDIREHDIPDVGFIELEDEETGEQLLLDTSDEEFRRSYRKIIKDQHTGLVKRLGKLKIDMVQLQTDKPFEAPLQRFFRLREQRMVR